MIELAQDLQKTEIRQICNIPIRNLWLLMLYASNLYRHLGTSKIAIEENPEEIADLVAEILCHEVEIRLMRNLSYGYQLRIAVLGRVRGRIDVLRTARHRLLEKGKVCCKFDELTINTPRNRYVLAALNKLIQLDITNEQLSDKCKTLAVSLERLGISKTKSTSYSRKSERFGLHDNADQKMIAAAELAFLLALPTELGGQFHLVTPDNEEVWLRKLFEKAIVGFYAITLDKNEWQVLPEKKLNWKISDKSKGIDDILPSMKTDIIIKQRNSDKQLIIDTKFNAITKQGRYREQTLRSNYIYQMYAYLRSQEELDNKTSLSNIGMLLHPSIDKEVEEFVVIQGHPIWFCTVNLGAENTVIRERLLSLINSCFA